MCSPAWNRVCAALGVPRYKYIVQVGVHGEQKGRASRSAPASFGTPTPTNLQRNPSLTYARGAAPSGVCRVVRMRVRRVVCGPLWCLGVARRPRDVISSSCMLRRDRGGHRTACCLSFITPARCSSCGGGCARSVPPLLSRGFVCVCVCCSAGPAVLCRHRVRRVPVLTPLFSTTQQLFSLPQETPPPKSQCHTTGHTASSTVLVHRHSSHTPVQRSTVHTQHWTHSPRRGQQNPQHSCTPHAITR